MLTLTGLTKTFGDRRVLDRMDLEIAAGESVAMLGANGSGKTTTLRCIVGLARPDAGRIVIGGVDLARESIRRAAGSATCRRGRCFRRR
jgi:phosphonate transport system ATP-binding protein